MTNNLDSVISFLRDRDNFLLLAHEKPDGDAIGSLLGLALMLRNAGKKATPLLRDAVPEKYLPLLSGIDYRTELSDAELAAIPNAVILDSARKSRIAAPCPMEVLEEKALCCIDHHIDDDVDSPARFVQADAAATAEIVANLPFAVPPRAADMLYLGILTDTGGFRFSNTSAATFETAAKLRRCGANHEKIVNAVFFSKTPAQQKLEGRMITECEHSEFGGKYLWAAIPDEVFAECGFDMRDGETVIELLREIGSTVICALLYRRDGAWKVSLRSKDARYSVGAIARAFGGGGHELAAGITVKNLTLDELTAKLKQEIGKYFL